MSLLLAALVTIPPPMSRRFLELPAAAPSGEVISRQIEGKRITFFFPRGWKPQRRQRIAVHFHGPDWLTFAEHVRAGLTIPAINAAVGEGSTVYSNLVRNPATMRAWLAQMLIELRRRGASADTTIEGLDLSSFSAGYGAIRELIQQPEIYALTRSVILCDSMYGSLAADRPRRPTAEHTNVWVPLAMAAIAGEKTFVVSVSSVATPYASSSECQTALVEAVGGTMSRPPDSWPASHDAYFSLVRYYDQGRFFAWRYSGYGPGAHTTHYRHLADIRMALPTESRQGS